MQEALRSGRWAISSQVTERRPTLFEERFAAAFGAYCGVPSCVPVDHGSSALITALEALQLPTGSHIVVPALTWVATASAVFRAGYVPVVADVDYRSGNLSAETVANALTPQTAAVIVVHWASTMADMDGLIDLCTDRGLFLIEDAAQAHGAAWRGRRAGSLGDFGCFSLQQAKVLACGEGGCVVSRHADAQIRLEELRADSRSYRSVGDRAVHELALQESAGIMGSNFGLGELAAALALAQLEWLPEQNRIREVNYRRLIALADEYSALSLPRPSEHQTALSIYEVPIRIEASGKDVDQVAAELGRDLGLKFYRSRPPLVGSRLLRPETKASLRPLSEEFWRLHAGKAYPNAEHFSEEFILFHHSVLLADEDEFARLVSAFERMIGV